MPAPRRNNKDGIVQSILLLTVCLSTVTPPAGAEGVEAQQEITKLAEVVVAGSRVPGRSAQDSPMPVDVLEGKPFRHYGVRDVDSLLRATIPSCNVNQQPINDAATLVRPANLRGLPPDGTLVPVNGKRRHRASVLTFLGVGISDGSRAPDLAAIPAIALDRVEVPRDGALARYGSDAIAGVMTFVLKDAPHGGTLETRWGQFYKGDGDTFNGAANLGLPLPLPFIKSGFANFSFEYNNVAPTSRSVQRDDDDDDFLEFHANDDEDRIDADERLLVALEASYAFKAGLTVASGAQNPFNAFPTEIHTGARRARNIPSLLPMDSTADSMTSGRCMHASRTPHPCLSPSRREDNQEPPSFH